LSRGAEWLPRIGNNNHSLVTAKLRFVAWHSMVDSGAAVSCAAVDEYEQSKGAVIRKTLVLFAVAVEEGVIVVDVSFVAITSNINKQDDTHFCKLCVRLLCCSPSAAVRPLCLTEELSFEACRETKS
jgi:hypothetical protein